MLPDRVLAALAIVTNNATVLYTFSPPLKASLTFYLGLALVVLGWIGGALIGVRRRRRRLARP